MSLMQVIEETRRRTKRAVGQIMKETAMPAYLMEGIIEGVLSDIREQKNAEMKLEQDAMLEQMRKETEEKKKTAGEERQNGPRKNRKTH